MNHPENVKYLDEVSEFVNNPLLPDQTVAETFKGITGLNVMGTYAPLGTPDWAVMIELPLSEAYREIFRGAVLSSIMTAVMAVLAGMIGVYMARRLAAPILGLTETATRIATGEMGLRAATTGPSEVVSLAQAFNRMTEQLGTLLQTVQARSVELEERTKELEASQRVTFAASEHATPDELLDLVVNLIRDQFDLYHAQVYMVDEEKQAAVLRQSTGYAGRQLLQRKHHIPLDATSLVTRAIHTGEPVLVDDVQAAPDFLPNPLLPDTRSELVIPLKREGKVIGALDAQDRTPGRFGSSTVALFQTMADQVTILFENSELLQRVVDQSEVMRIFTNQLRTAADIARRLGTILDPELLLQEVVELIQSRFGLYHAHIYLLDEEKRLLKLATGSGEVGRVLRERGHSISLDAEKSLVARAARTRGTVLVADTTLESDFMPNPLLPQTRSELSIPLVVSNTVLGVLDLQDDQAGRFTEAERDTFGTLAGQIATAIQNAHLFEERQHAEQLAQEQRLFLRRVIDATPNFIFVKDRDGKFVLVNKALADAYGTTVEELIGKSDADFNPNVDEVRAFLEADRAVMDSQQELFIPEEPITDSQGNLRWLQTTKRPLIGPDGVANQILGVSVDITERKQAEEIVRESRQMLQMVMDNLPESIFWKDKNLVYLGCNTNFAHDAGFDSPEQVIGKTDHDMPWKDQVALYQADDRHVLETGEAKVNYEEPQTTPDGGLIWLRTTKVPLYNAQGEVYAVLGAYADITAMKQAQAEIQKRASELQTVAEVGTAAATILDPDQLLSQVVELTKANFGLYHAHIYLIDEAGESLVLAAGAGEAGKQMKAQGWKIAANSETSLVARAFRTREGVIVNDVRAAPDFLPNPLLPNTRSELAVPLIVGEHVLGVLDVQSDQLNHFTDEDILIQTTLAGQIATAIQNAHLFEERQHAEQLAQEQRLFLRRVIDATPNFIFVKDRDGKFVLVNKALADAYGTTVEELIGKSDADFNPNVDEVRAFLEADRAVMDSQQELFIPEEPITDSQGNLRWLQTTKRPLIGPDGVANQILGVSVDITERKQAEEIVRESRQMLQMVMDNLPESIFWKDKNLVYLGCNTNFAHDAGFDSPEQVIGKTDHDMPWKDQVALYQADDRHVLETGEAKVNYEEPQTTPDGGLIWLRTTKVPLYNAQGEVYAVLGAYADITAMKQAQAEIQKRASELQTVAEVGTAAATILDPDQLLSQVVELTKANFGLYHAHIYLIDEAGESLVLAAGAGEAGKQMKAQGWKIAANSETSLVARAFRTREGVIVNDVRAAPDFLPNPLLPNTRSELAVPLIVGEHVLGVLDVQSDQLNHFTDEDILIQTTLAGQIATAIENARLFQETRQVDRLKSEFLANMSHELRTPLNSIIGYIQLLLMDLEGQVPEESYEDMQSIETNSKHLLNLINDILDLAKIEAGRLELHMEPLEVGQLLDTVKSNNAGLFIDSPLNFEVVVEPGLPRIYADPVRIMQVLNNLISNAFKFTETGGITVRAYRDANDVCIAVEDTGIGIAEEDIDKIFERFRQVDGSFTRRAEGTGLGLSITRLLVEMHNGKLTVRSKLGKGSTFTVYLPAIV